MHRTGTERRHIRCNQCGHRQAFGLVYECPACGGNLEVVHPDGFDPALMPALPAELVLGEGNTPLLATRPGLLIDGFEGEILLKDETRNPSGSFKDRFIAAAIAEALVLGAPGVVCASSGNAGASAAAYAARVGLPAIIVVPERTPAGKLTQIAAHGARLVKVAGHYSNSYDMGRRIAEEAGFVNLTTTFLNPIGTDGLRRVGHEIFAQLGGRVPDWVMVPTGAGPLVKGVVQGFADMGATLPRLVAVQAEGCAPVVRAFEAGDAAVRAWDEPRTFASGISDPLIGYEKDGTYTLALVRQTGGIAIAVSDDEIRAAMHRLARGAGVLAEPTGASGLAAAAKMVRAGLIGPADSVVLMVSGHGFKDFAAWQATPAGEIGVAAGADVAEVLAAIRG